MSTATTAYDVAKAFLKLSDDDSGDVVTNLKLQKLVYYAQGFHMAINGQPLFEDDLEAWEHGPVVPDLYHKFKRFKSSQVEVDDMGEINVSEKQMKLIADINNVYGQFSAWKLRDMTHNEQPWKEAQRGGIISKEKLKSYFSTQLKTSA